ncbi:penicillin acylase family protein [Parashewanella curva]|uniref:Penicillin acylase family protein n=1 Tax=Parashewanella curva TaxID=2338552 RepID=A0A3L8Q0U6_9GAMM|nr:penicillin acylase family protein [Parashewanella curva]RLV60679.1 penicillin acylase family protein [Parashewanella curva]
MKLGLSRTLKSLVLFAVIAMITVFMLFRLSLPQLNGSITTSVIKHPVDVTRDSQGVPTITGKSRADVAFATGYLHAQERFFQMDLARRNSAGELAELFGERAINYDKKQRIHRFRLVASQSIKRLPKTQKQILNAYTLGVNQGLKDLTSKPFEYWLLNLAPKPWKPEDSFLVIYSMYLDLNDPSGHLDATKGFLAKIVSPKVLAFLSPPYTRWDSPLHHDHKYRITIPNKDEINLRSLAPKVYASMTGNIKPEIMIGSNNFAVAGELTPYHSAMVEDDMHLGLRVPTTWYRAQLRYPSSNKQQMVKVTGVTLPGVPSMIVGSNGQVAWAFTNSYGDWVDLIKLKIDGNEYFTKEGKDKFHTWYDTLNIKGQSSIEMKFNSTRWGPVIDSPYTNRKYALMWTAHKPSATNVNLMKLETANTVKEAIDIANQSGLPPQNITIADSQGNIGWSIAGKIPKRNHIDTRLPIDWRMADTQWQGWISPNAYPKVINPAAKRIWTANARIASGKDLHKIGDGGYALGARQQQIRDHLMSLKHVDEQKLLSVATDSRALYLSHWRKLMLEALTPNELEGHPERAYIREQIQQWSGHAQPHDHGYRIVREFHDQLNKTVLQSIGRYLLYTTHVPHKELDDTWIQGVNHEREMLLTLYEHKPMNWLSPQYKDWDQLFLQTIDSVIAKLAKQNHSDAMTALKAATWGQRNTAAINHPLSSAIPIIGKYLNMPAVELAGDNWMPSAQRPNAGVSERMIVAPGHEDKGIFHMPGGQSGHPLSPYYKSGFNDWVEANPSPLLPGKTKYALKFIPQK